MKRYPELKPTKYDALVVLAVLALALALGARYRAPSDERSGALTVVVTVDGAEIERTPLSAYAGAPHVYGNLGYTVTVAASDGAVRVTESTCPNHDCQHTPPASRAGQSIICLPARIIIALESAADVGYDLIAG